MSLFLCMFECFKNTHLIKIQAIINNDCRTFSLPSLAKDHFESVSPKLVQQTTKVAQSPLAKTTLKFLIRVLHFLFFGDFFPTYMAYTFIYFLEKFPPTYTVFYIIHIKNPTYTSLLRPTRLLISEKTSHIHDY